MYFIVLVGKLKDDELDMNRITMGDAIRDLSESNYTPPPPFLTPRYAWKLEFAQQKKSVRSETTLRDYYYIYDPRFPSTRKRDRRNVQCGQF